MNKYFDNAATTLMKSEVAQEMEFFYSPYYANASSMYDIADIPYDAICNAKEIIANKINCNPEEIYFTSGGTESDNWALKGIADKNPGCHIITSKIEHHAILNTCEYLEKKGHEVSYINCDIHGQIKLHELIDNIKFSTKLISVMMANNEIGSIQHISEIGRIAHENGILFHTDAVQAMCHIPIDVRAMDIDMLSASAHKFHGPKGVGFLYIRKGIDIEPLIHGGNQQNGMRSGTYNTPGIVGMGKAVQISKYGDSTLRDLLVSRVLSEISDVSLNGSLVNRLPNNANFTFKGVSGEMIVALLAEKNIYCSTGSACASDSGLPSHVLTSIGLSVEDANSSVRITLGDNTSYEDVEVLVNELKSAIEMLR